MLWLDPLYRAAVLEIAQLFGLTGGADPTSDRPAEQGQRCLERQDPALGDLRWLDDHCAQDGVVEDTTVKEEAHTTWTARPGAQEVQAHEPTGGDVEAALLFGLAATSLPGDSPSSITPPGIVQPPLYVGFRMSNRPFRPRIRAPADAGMVGTTTGSSGPSPALTSRMEIMLGSSRR